MTDWGIKSIKRKPLGQEVTEILKRKIVVGDLGPKERLVEERLARDIGISRTPVREALHRLEQEGLLTKRPRGGYEVRPLTPEEVQEAVGVRAVLEAYAAEMAAQRADEESLAALVDNLNGFEEALVEEDEARLVALNSEFHLLLYRAAGSPLLHRFLEELQEIVERISRALISNMPAGEWSCTDHRDLVEAIITGRAEDAAALAKSHVLHGGKWIISRMVHEGLEL